MKSLQARNAIFVEVSLGGVRIETFVTIPRVPSLPDSVAEIINTPLSNIKKQDLLNFIYINDYQ